MTNTELTLNQLQTINGGAAFMKLGDIKGECRQIVHPEFKTSFHTPFGTARSKESFGSFEPRDARGNFFHGAYTTTECDRNSLPAVVKRDDI